MADDRRRNDSDQYLPVLLNVDMRICVNPVDEGLRHGDQVPAPGGGFRGVQLAPLPIGRIQ